MDSFSSSSPAPSRYMPVQTKLVDLDKITKLTVEDEEKTKVGGKWANNLMDSKSSSSVNFVDSYETPENTYNSFLNFEINNSSPKILPNNLAYEIFNENNFKKKDNQIQIENGSKLDSKMYSLEEEQSRSAKSTTYSDDSIPTNYIIDYPFKAINHPSELRHPVLNFVKFFASALVNLFLLIPVVILFIFCQPLRYLFKSTFKLLHLCHLTSTSFHSPSFIPEFLTPIELFWLYNSNQNETPKKLDEKQSFEYESNLSNKSIGACILFIEGYISKNALKELIKNKIIQLSTRSGRRIYERFTQRLYKLFLFGFVWLNCSEFDIEDHIVEINEDNSLKTVNDIQECVASLIQTHKFKKDKPLWTLYYVKSFGNDRSSVLIFLFHMCFADGVSLVRLFFKGLVDNRNSVEIKPRFAYFTFKFDFVKQIFLGWSEMIYSFFFRRSDKNPLNKQYLNAKIFENLDLNTKIPQDQNTQNEANYQINNRPYVLTWSEPFSLYTTNRLKLVTRSKMNDIFMSILAGIMRNYLQKKGINNPLDMSCIMPIDLTSNKYPFKLENKSALCSIKSPVNTEGCIPRLWSTKYTTGMLKRTGDYLFLFFYKYFLFNFFPSYIAFYLIKYLINKNTFIASTLGAGDSSLQTVSLCNRNVKNIIYFYPTACNISISFSVITYGDEVRLSLMADSNVITKPKLITREFVKQLEILSDLLSHRRIPGEIKRSTRPVFDLNGMKQGSSKLLYLQEEASIEEMQQKMSDIQHELQYLSENFQRLDSNDSELNRKKQLIAIKTDKLKKDFGEILSKFQVKQNLTSHTIPSDDEDDLDTADRIRLRSSSIASKVSVNSNSRRNRDSTCELESNKTHSRQQSKVCSRENSIMPDVNSNLSVENEISSNKNSKKHRHLNTNHHDSHHARNKNLNIQNVHSSMYQSSLSSEKNNEKISQRISSSSDSE